MSWIEFGVPYDFPDGPPPGNRGLEYQLSKELDAVRDQELQRFSDLGVVRPLPPEDVNEATFCGIFIVRQPNKDRPIIDQRFPNSFTRKVHFKMDSIKDVRDLIQNGDYLIKIDLKDAYLHMKYRKQHWKYGAFWWRGEPFCFSSMMFGHTHAPRWFTKLMRPVVKHLREKGIRCVIYIDDILIFCGPDFKEALRIRDFVLNFILSLGLTVNMKKSILNPVRRLPFLGFIVNSRKMTFSVEDKKLSAVKKDLRRLVKRRVASPRDLARILGKLNSMANAILPCRLRTRSMLLSKNQALRHGCSWDECFPLSDAILSELNFWLTQIKDWNGRMINDPEPNWITTSDSSGTAYGGHSTDSRVAHSWEPELEGGHSTHLETTAAARVISEIIMEEGLYDGVLLHRSDNTTAVSYLNKQGGRVPTISKEAEALWDFCLERGIILKATYVPGINLVEADFLSRMKNKDSELRLLQEDFARIQENFGTPEVDLFATRFNHLVDKFVTLHPDPKALGSDAFSMDWRTLGLSYAFPPFNMIGRILAKARREGNHMILVTPNWEGATWIPDLRNLATPQSPIRLSNKLRDFEGREKSIKWSLNAWMLSGRT